MKLKHKARQKGYGIFTGLLFLVVIGAVGVTGWWVSINQSAQAESASKAAQTVAIPEPKTDSRHRDVNDMNYGYLEIKEWGLKLKKSSVIQHATYTFVAGAINKRDVIYLTTRETQETPGCAQHYQAAGVPSHQYIVQYDLNDTVMISDQKTAVTALQAATSGGSQKRDYMLFGNKVYAYQTLAGSPCQDADGLAVQQAYRNAFSDINK